MRLATFVDPLRGNDARFGIVSGENMIDVAVASDTLHRAVPATSVKVALTSGAHTLAALKELVKAAEGAKLWRPIAGLKFLPPIPDPSKFFCVGKNNKKHREELAANKMLTEVPNEPTGFIKLTSTMSGDGDEVVKPAGIVKLDYEPELCYVVGKRAHGVKKADAMEYISGFTLTNDVSAREIQQREVASGSRFWTAKNMPGFAPVGPYILTMDEVPDTDNLRSPATSTASSGCARTPATISTRSPTCWSISRAMSCSSPAISSPWARRAVSPSASPTRTSFIFVLATTW
jgi:2-keto-4-pentenoate hydratase/2-oxohepta-3-ene-1,7-dioic acid hydratase in catechol pathway